VGKKGAGKTYETLKTVSSYLRGDAISGVRPRNVLIMDVNNEYANVQQDHDNPMFPKIKTIKLEHVKLIAKKDISKSGAVCYRVAPFNGDGTPMSINEVRDALQICLQDFSNGLFIIEDINKIISDSLPNDLVGKIVTMRHVSVDIITHFQSIGKAANPKLWANANYIRFHKCDDTVRRHESKFGGDVTGLKVLETLIEMNFKADNKRFCAFYDKNYGTVRGNFTLPQFRAAVIKYLEYNPSVIKSEAARMYVDGAKSGQKIHANYGVAGGYLIQDYIKLYYGNSNTPKKETKRTLKKTRPKNK